MTALTLRSEAAPSRGRRLALVVLCAVVAGAAACGSAPVGPTAAPTTTPGSTATAAPSARPPASTGPDPGAAALKAFVALVTADGFSYQATFSGSDRHTTDIIPLSKGLLQVSGADVLVRTTFSFGSQTYQVEHRYVADKAWIRYDTGDAWQRLAFHPADSMAAFASVRSAADVTYLGPVAAGTTTLYKVSFRSAIVNPVMVPATNLTETVVTSPRLELLIDAAGRPVKATAAIVGRGRVSGQLQEIVIDLTVTFTKVGQAVSIKAP